MPDCASCRVRHLKCDRRPVCSQCESAGRKCVRGYNVRFRNLACPSKTFTPADYSKYEFFFGPDQTWTSAKGGLEFVDENHDVANAYLDHGADDAADHDALSPEVPEQVHLQQPSSLSPGIIGDHPVYSSSYGSSKRGTYPTPSTLYEEQDDTADQGPLHQQDEIKGPQQDLAYFPTYSYERAGWPLKCAKEFYLLQHYIDKLGSWFDVADSKRHFTKTAPIMAASSPLLMNAILAISALHLSRVSDYDAYEAVRYHDRCLQLMVPMLNDHNEPKDDNLLMTTVFLHLYEDLDSGGNSRRHLLATSVVLPARGICISSRLRRAVFWVHLRQEIYIACIEQCTVQADLDNCTSDSPLDSADDDDVWVHRSLWICAQVLQWAFGGDATQTRWRELRESVDDWDRRRPSSFDPALFQPRDTDNGRWFPDVCHITDEHVIGAHFIYLAKLFLTTHDPTIPRIGPRMKSATAEMQETSLSYVRTMCGIAVCNRFVVARFTASLAIIICGSWFKDRREQEALIDFMQTVEQCSGWPRHHAQKSLMADWGWQDL